MEGSTWRTDVEQGYRTKTIQYKNCTIIVNRPVFSPEQQAKREREVMQGVARVLLEMERRLQTCHAE